MPISTTYTITNTQGSLTFQMTAGSSNGPNELAQTTDLTFYGYGRTGWGQQVDQNFYSLLENFACNQLAGPNVVPSTKATLGGTLGINDPVKGQQWYNLTSSEMYYCVTPSTNTWYHLLSETYADTKYLTLAEASSTSGNYAFVKLSGANTPMTGPLILNADPTSGSPPQTAATKNYVDTNVSTLTSLVNGNYVHIAGDTMKGPLSVTNGLGDGMFATLSTIHSGSAYLQMGQWNTSITSANVNFYTSGSSAGVNTVDSAIIATGGTIGSNYQGTLTLYGYILTDGRPPTLANQLTSKNYVDTQISTNISSLHSTITTTLASGYLALSGGTMSGFDSIH